MGDGSSAARRGSPPTIESPALANLAGARMPAVSGPISHLPAPSSEVIRAVGPDYFFSAAARAAACRSCQGKRRGVARGRSNSVPTAM